MPSLYDRAGQRCRQNILKAYPAHRQAHLTADELPAFEAWKAVNVEHLKALRDAIVAGEAPDIDRGWPQIAHPEPVSVSGAGERGAEAAVEYQAPPPEIIEVEKVVHVENPETQERLAEALNEKAELKAALEEALGKLEARKASVDEFPEELLDLVRENEPHADALNRLRGDYVQLTNRLVDTRLPALSNLERAYQNRLQKALYSERKGAVEITD